MPDQNASIINDLIATTIDSVDGYTKAADDAEDARFATLFRDRASERTEVVMRLKSEVRRLGVEPEDDGTILAGAHRMFLGLKEAVVGKDDKAIVQEVERGEDHIKDKYQKALADDDLTGVARATVQECYVSVQQGHDQMSAIKSTLEAAS